MSKLANEFREDLLTGAAEIGGYLGWKVRKVYHAAEKGYLPIKKPALFSLRASRNSNAHCLPSRWKSRECGAGKRRGPRQLMLAASPAGRSTLAS
jgi:hypothetical protein